MAKPTYPRAVKLTDDYADAKLIMLLNEGSGNYLHDMSDNYAYPENHGATWVTESGSPFLRFDTNDYGYIPVPNVQITGAQTWNIRLRTTQVPTNWGYATIIARGNFSIGGAVAGLEIGLQTDGLLAFGTCNGVLIKYALSNDVINTGEWITITVVYTPSVSMKIYLNGVINKTETSGILTSLNPAVLSYCIGARNNNTYFFDGDIDFVHIYDSAFTDAQVEALVAEPYRMISEQTLRNFSTLTRYSDDVYIIPYNTGDYDVLDGSSPFFRFTQKIGNRWIAITQANHLGYQFKYLLAYGSTNLKDWTVLNNGEPVFQADPYSWDTDYIVHPSVIKIGDTWYMYYSGLNSSSKIGLATSPDLINWTRHGSTPIYSEVAYSPWVIKIGSTYYMYYWNSAGNMINGMDYATSPDGINWTYGGHALIRNTLGDWDAGYVNMGFDPCVIQTSEGYYELYYTINTGVYQKIGVAYSEYGRLWYKDRRGFILERSGTPGAIDEGNVGDPVAIEIGGSLYLYYSGAMADQTHGGGCLVYLSGLVNIQTEKDEIRRRLQVIRALERYGERR